MSSIQNKKNLRDHFRVVREQIGLEARIDASDKITERVLGLPQWEAAQSVFIYVAISNEVQTGKLIETALKQGKETLIPRVSQEGQMHAVPIANLHEGLTTGIYGIPTCEQGDPHPQSVDLVLTPGLAFTLTGARLGQGGGNYDRYLDTHPSPCVIGLAFTEQIVEQLPTEAHDHQVNYVATPTQIIACD